MYIHARVFHHAPLKYSAKRCVCKDFVASHMDENQSKSVVMLHIKIRSQTHDGIIQNDCHNKYGYLMTNYNDDVTAQISFSVRYIRW